MLGYAAGAANVIMQLSWPEVGHGVVESRVSSGNVLHHPIKRARTTFTYLAVAVAGTDLERVAYRHAVNAVHRKVRSSADSPVAYDALDPGLQQWVAACLYVGFEDTHQILHGRLDPEDRAAFYSTSVPLATTLQVRHHDWPSSAAAFDDAWARQCDRVAIDDVVRAHLEQVVGLAPAPRWMQRSLAPRMRFLTNGFLPPLFREQMQWPWTAADQARFERFWTTAARINARVPVVARSGANRLLLADLRRRKRAGKPLV